MSQQTSRQPSSPSSPLFFFFEHLQYTKALTGRNLFYFFKPHNKLNSYAIFPPLYRRGNHGSEESSDLINHSVEDRQRQDLNPDRSESRACMRVLQCAFVKQMNVLTKASTTLQLRCPSPGTLLQGGGGTDISGKESLRSP